MSEEKPNFRRKIPVPNVPAPGESGVRPEDLGAERVIPDPQGTIIGKVPEEETRIVTPPAAEKPFPSLENNISKSEPETPEKPAEEATPPSQASLGQSPASQVPLGSGQAPLGSSQAPLGSSQVPLGQAASGANILGTTPEPRPIAFTPGSGPPGGLSTFDNDEEDGEGGSSAALLIAIAAFLVAVLGLLVAIGVVPLGPSTSLIGQDRLADNSVGEPQIQDQSVSLNKIQPEIIDKLQGPEGPEGPAGPRGKAGPPGAALGAIELRSKEVSGTSTSSRASALVTCDSGEVLLSGGAALSGAEGKVAIVASNPSSENNAWFAESARIDPENNDSWTLTVYARCAQKNNAG